MGEPHYSCCDPQNATCVAMMHSNEFFLATWCALFPDDPEVDIESYISTLMPLTGLGRTVIRTNLNIADQLLRMPNLLEHARKLRHLDRSRLVAIERGCVAVQDEYLPLVEAALVEFLTPTCDCEALPHARAITEFLRRTIDPIDPCAVEAEPFPEEEQFNVSHVNHGLSSVQAFYREDEAREIDKILSTVSSAHQCTKARALLLTLRDHTNVTVTFNVYAPATGEGAVSLDGGLTLSTAAADEWRERATQERDITAVATKRTSSYAIPETYKAFVKGRDGGCRFPGCTVGPEHCDIDHVVAFSDGGETTPSNLQCLCRRCHNLKTDRVVTPKIGADATVTWSMPDGSTVVTRPRGVVPTPPQVTVERGGDRHETQGDKRQQRIQWRRKQKGTP